MLASLRQYVRPHPLSAALTATAVDRTVPRPRCGTTQSRQTYYCCSPLLLPRLKSPEQRNRDWRIPLLTQREHGGPWRRRLSDKLGLPGPMRVCRATGTLPWPLYRSWNRQVMTLQARDDSEVLTVVQVNATLNCGCWDSIAPEF